jgi:hypothetical protein
VTKTRNILAAFAAAACTAATVTSQAATLFCYTPGLTFFTDVVSTVNHTLYLTCESQNNQGTVTTAKAVGGGNTDTLAIQILSGTSARIGGYNSNRQGINCFKVVINQPGQSGGGINCPAGQLAFYDMSVEG